MITIYVVDVVDSSVIRSFEVPDGTKGQIKLPDEVTLAVLKHCGATGHTKIHVCQAVTALDVQSVEMSLAEYEAMRAGKAKTP